MAQRESRGSRGHLHTDRGGVGAGDPEVIPRLADVAAVLGRLARFEIDAAVRATAAAYTDPGLRSLDAIHLATADQLRSSGKTISGFVTYDSRLAQAASSVGFAAQAPA